MCGLFGCITKKKRNESLNQEEVRKKTAVLSALAIAMESRGTDSTGVGVVKDDQHLIYKKAVHASKFIKIPDFKQIMAINPNIVIGHTRFATQGAVNDQNAHPFIKDRIMGAHNGSVSNYLTIDKKVEVDSEVIFKLLNDDKNDFSKSFDRLSGSFAITWNYSEDPNSLYMTKQSNPLYLVTVPEISTIFWCSEAIAIESIVQAVFGMRKKYVWTLKKDHVYKFRENLQVDKTKVLLSPAWTYQYNKGNNYGYGHGLNDWEDESDFYFGESKKSKKKDDESCGLTACSSYQNMPDEMIEIMEDIVNTDGCESCLNQISSDGFYWSEEHCTCLCQQCYLGLEARDDGDFDFITAKEYRNLLTEHAERRADEMEPKQLPSEIL